MIGLLLSIALMGLIILIARIQPSQSEATPVDLVTEVYEAEMLAKPTSGASDDRELSAVIANDILPTLYARTDVDSLLVGALLSSTDEVYSQADFVSLALSLDPDDIMANLVAAVICEPSSRTEQVTQSRPITSESRSQLQPEMQGICTDTDHLQRLASLTGDNGWVWMNLAERSLTDQQMRDLLIRAADAAYYGDYVWELRSMISAVLTTFSPEDSSGLRLAARVGLYALPVVPVRVMHYCVDRPHELRPECEIISEHLLRGSSAMGSMVGLAIQQANPGLHIDHWLTPDIYQLFGKQLASDPEFTATMDRYHDQYVETDAMRLTLIDFGFLPDAAVKPTPIAVH